MILSDGLSSFTTSAMFNVPKKGIYYWRQYGIENLFTKGEGFF